MWCPTTFVNVMTITIHMDYSLHRNFSDSPQFFVENRRWCLRPLTKTVRARLPEGIYPPRLWCCIVYSHNKFITEIHQRTAPTRVVKQFTSRRVLYKIDHYDNTWLLASRTLLVYESSHIPGRRRRGPAQQIFGPAHAPTSNKDKRKTI